MKYSRHNSTKSSAYRRLKRIEVPSRFTPNEESSWKQIRSFFPMGIAILALGVSVLQTLNALLSRNDGYDQIRLSRQIEECLSLAETVDNTSNKLNQLQMLRFWQNEDASKIKDIAGSAKEWDEASKSVFELKRMALRARIIFPDDFRQDLDKIGDLADKLIEENFSVLLGDKKIFTSAAPLIERADIVITDCNRIANKRFG